MFAKLKVWPYAAGVYAGHEFEPAKAGDAGLDLRAAESRTVNAGTTEAIGLGVSIQIPNGCVGWLTGRSSNALGRSLLTHEGKIDSGYRGEIHCLVTALGSPVEIAKGDRIAQLILLYIMPPVTELEFYGLHNTYKAWEIVDELDASERGDDGLGSTGLR